jgi:gliding motility-associated-like protein
MKKIAYIYCIFFLLICFTTAGQVSITAPNASGSSLTNYTGNSNQDSIFVFCSPTIDTNGAQLTATSKNNTELGVIVFSWSKFNPATNQYESYDIKNAIGSSTISNLEDGGYAVTVYSRFGVILGCARAWVYTNIVNLTVSKLPEFCGPFALNANIEHKNELTYYNPPADDLVIDGNTAITVCFSANHDYVSDLGFYLVGPEQCGSPRIKLMEAFAVSQNNDVCNDGNNVLNLCFSTNSTAYYVNPCIAPTPLTGNYASEENWSAIFGCQANLAGWKVQVFDCIDGDIGTLTHAQIKFESSSTGCRPIQIIYDSGELESTIKDNSCTPEKASTFEVLPAAALSLTKSNEVSFNWSEDAPFFELANNGFGNNISVPRPPKTNTNFEVISTDEFGCISEESLVYNFTPTNIPIIQSHPVICNTYDIQEFVGTPNSGIWNGLGIIDNENGLFDPALINGVTKVFYTDTSMCGGIAVDSFAVKSTPTSQLLGKSPICNYDNDGSISLVTSDTNYWSFNWYNDQWNLISEQDKFDPILENITIGKYYTIIDFSNQCIDTILIDFISKQLANVDIIPSTYETSVALPNITFYGTAVNPLTSSEFQIENKAVAFNTSIYEHEFMKLPGTYSASFIGSDDFGCYDTSTINVELIHEFAFYIPNTFTPNQDGVNDFLQVYSTDLDLIEYEFDVVNRWGDRVFYSRNIYDRWNGTFNNKIVPTGRYLYSVSGKSKTTGKTTEYTDFIFIIY